MSGRLDENDVKNIRELMVEYLELCDEMQGYTVKAISKKVRITIRSVSSIENGLKVGRDMTSHQYENLVRIVDRREELRTAIERISPGSLAEKFEVCKATIWNIAKGKTRGDVPWDMAVFNRMREHSPALKA